MRKSGNNPWTLLLLVLCGIVLGGFIGYLTKQIAYLNWLDYGQTFGLSQPVKLDLGILLLTFGLTIKISVASIIGVILAIIVYRKL